MNEEHLIDDGCPACRDNRGESARLSRRSLLRLGATAAAAAAVAPHIRTMEAAAVDLRSGRRAAPDLSFPIPPIVTRAQWGADESIRKGGCEYDDQVEKLIVHHTVTPNSPADPASAVRNVYRYHVSGDYIDIAYNWLIDHKGRIYEGRWSNDYPAGAPRVGERLGRQVRGGHTYRHNGRSIGIALLGTYTSQGPPAPMVESLVTLLAWKCSRWGIDPRASAPYRMADGGVHTVPNIMGHRDAKATTCPGDPVLAVMSSVRDRVAGRMRRSEGGYWIASANGSLLSFGGRPDLGDLQRLGVNARIIAFAPHPSGNGYWMLGSDGGVFSFGEARFHGGLGGRRLARPVVGMAPTPSGNGYWLVASDGGVFSYGDAKFYGSTGDIRLREPVVGMAPTPDGRGYWLVAADGGVFGFGNAPFHGSTGGTRLREPVVGMASTPSGRGYWLVARDGGVFNFGDAPFAGSAFGHTRSSVVEIASSKTGRGYAVVNRSGEVYAFGDAPYMGGAAGRLSDVVGFGGKLTLG